LGDRRFRGGLPLRSDGARRDGGRLTTQGAVDTFFRDIDTVVPGSVATDGSVTFAENLAPGRVGVVDEIAWLSGARLIAVRREDVPGDGDLAAILRYAA
jgi:hypothetical protein